MLTIDTLKKSENMMCLEFDLSALPPTANGVNLRENLFIINQNFTDSILQFNLNGTCHGQNIFGPNDACLSFQI